MRRWKVILFLLITSMLFSSPALAANKNNSISVSMDGKKYTVKEVPVVIDGQAVYSDIPTFIHPINDYTLVPIRFVAERYGAEVTWDQKTKTATINQKNKIIKVTINSKYMYIDGERKLVGGGVSPKLVTFANKDSRTMVPLRVISEALGFEVGWDNLNRVPYINTLANEEPEEKNTREVTNIKVEKGSTNKLKLSITGTEKLSYSTLQLENPSRLVVDIEDAVLNLKDNISFENGIGKIEVNSNPINRINVSQFSSKPDVVRVVINLTEKSDFDIISSKDGKSLTLSFVNKVGKIEKEIIDGKEAIVIYNTRNPEMKVMKMTNPGRIVLDLLDSSLVSNSNSNYNYEIGFIKGVRTAQFSPDNLYKPNDRIVRVVLDIKDGISEPNVKIDTYDNKIIITPETNLGEIINYSMEGINRIVSVKTTEDTNYDIDYSREKNTMIINIPSDKVDLKEGVMNINDGLINHISVNKGGNITKVIVTFRKGIEYTVLSNDIDSNISISMKKDNNIKPSDRLIVIDPGHGGPKPGTVQNGYKEKDVNLAVSLKLNEQLKSKGYKTIMTRDTDIDVGLYDRANLANNNYADLFLSIHANSFTNSNVSGIQVLYRPKSNATLDEKTNYLLAEIIMDEMVKGTGAQNKGIIKRTDLAVLNTANVPANLIELGFLSNPEEAKLLNDSAYQDILVESIIKGIEKFFEMY